MLDVIHQFKFNKNRLYHHFNKKSKLMNGTVPRCPPKAPIPKPSVKVQVMSDKEIAERKTPEQRLPRQANHKIKVMTMKMSKDLEFPMVALPGVGHMPAKGEDEKEAARVFYVAATRATQRLVIGVGGDGGFGIRLGT